MEIDLKLIKTAQLATAIDAEGNVGLYRSSRRTWKTKKWRVSFYPTIVLTNINREWLLYFKNFVNSGCLDSGSKTSTGKTLYRVVWRCRKAYRIAKMVLPWIIIKQKKIKNIIEWYDGK